jgi:hypothetical protein
LEPLLHSGDALLGLIRLAARAKPAGRRTVLEELPTRQVELDYRFGGSPRVMMVQHANIQPFDTSDFLRRSRDISKAARPAVLAGDPALSLAVREMPHQRKRGSRRRQAQALALRRKLLDAYGEGSEDASRTASEPLFRHENRGPISVNRRC